MESSYIDYADFIDVAVEAFDSASKHLFAKIVRKVIHQFHQQSVALQKKAFELDEMHSLPTNDLDEFYDTLLDSVENIKLLQKELKPLLKKDALFVELQEESERLHEALVHYMDRMGQLETRLLEDKASA